MIQKLTKSLKSQPPLLANVFLLIMLVNMIDLAETLYIVSDSRFIEHNRILNGFYESAQEPDRTVKDLALAYFLTILVKIVSVMFSIVLFYQLYHLMAKVKLLILFKIVAGLYLVAYLYIIGNNFYQFYLVIAESIRMAQPIPISDLNLSHYNLSNIA